MRFLLQDTVETGASLSDEEIEFLNSESANVWGAAASGALALATKVSDEGKVKVGDLELSGTDAATQYRAMSKSLRAQGARQGKPVGFPLTIDDKKDERADDDRLPFAFRVGLHEPPGSVVSSSTDFL